MLWGTAILANLSAPDPVGNVTAWVYDNLDRVVSEENENGDFRYFVYDANSQLTEKTDRNGRVTEYEYDNLGRQTAEKWMDGMTVLHAFTYVYDAGNRLTSASDVNDQVASNNFDVPTQILVVLAETNGSSTVEQLRPLLPNRWPPQ
ncbi:MAG: hypothetical protein AB7I37_12075 [Pirellulales bacterium]